MSPRKCLAFAIALAAAGPGALAQENPAARRSAADLGMLAGFWNGANLENRSGCTTPGVNGIHGTYAQYLIGWNAISKNLTITENTVTSLSCTYAGFAVDDERLRPGWSGAFNCSDGKRGTFQSTSFLISPTEMQVRLQIKLESPELCDIDSILGGSRF